MRLLVAIALLCCTLPVASPQSPAPPKIDGSQSPALPKITKASAGNESITLTFDQPMLTWDERGNLGAVRIEPEVSCQWFWEDDTDLTCRAPNQLKPFHPASAYRLVIGRGLWSQNGVEMAPAEVVAETSRPELAADIRDWNSGVPEFRLTTSWKVTPEAIGKVVSLDLEGQPVHYEIVPVPDDPARRRYYTPAHAFDLHLLDLPSRPGLAHVRVRPGLQGSDGPLLGKQDEELVSAWVNEPFKLRGVHCGRDSLGEVSHTDQARLKVSCEPDQPIGLRFSRMPGAAAVAAFKSSLPPGLSLVESGSDSDNDYASSARALSPDAMLYVKSSAARTDQRITLPVGFAAADGTALTAPVEIVVHVRDYDPGIEIKPRVLVAPTGSTELPVLRTRNISGGIRLTRMTIGEQANLLPSRIETSTPPNILLPAALPPTPDAIRDHGGLVLAGAQDRDDLGYAIAYAPFDVLVGKYDGQLLVWASTWGESRNLANANVELLAVDPAGNEQSMGAGTTGADGVALLDVSGLDWDQRTGLRLIVSVTHDGLRTLVPVKRYGYDYRFRPLFDDDYHGTSGSHHDRTSFKDGRSRTFGVTERPLYRPRESVNYRIWYRQRRGNHLLRTDRSQVTMVLRSAITDKILERWPATLGAAGSTSSSLRLPELLPDDYYCIEVLDDDAAGCWSNGAGFQVARFEAQSMWAQLDADRKLVMAGQDLGLDLESGYFSGDAAAGVSLKFSGLLTPRRVEDAYPDFAGYTFIDPLGREPTPEDAINPLRGVPVPTATDRSGKAHVTLHLPTELHAESEKNEPLVFGLLEFNAEASVQGKASASSGTAAVNYSQYPRFVGLKSARWWLAIDRDPALEAVVIDAAGHVVTGQTVQVAIEAEDTDAGTSKEIGHCALSVDHATPCDFRAPKAGLYRFRANAMGAAPTEFERWIGEQAPADTEKQQAKASLKLLHATDGTSPVRVKLSQPYPHANVLFTLEYGRVTRHWVQDVDSDDSDLEIPVLTDWAPGITLNALIIARDPSAPRGGFGSRTYHASLDLDIPRLRSDALAVSVERPRIAPGDDLVLQLANPAAGPHHATIAVVDDSVYQQAMNVNGIADPAKDDWLGSLDSWDGSSWYGLEGWTSFANPFFQAPKSSSLRARRVEAETASPAMILDRYSAAKNLDTVTVTGSRIRAVDVFVRTSAAQAMKRRAAPRPGKPLPRMRSTFLDSAYWNPDVPLAAGETKELRIHLPDNLTRWRVLVWASDDQDGFALSQATVETSLPIELRAGLPGQLYVGDRATASISARNHGGNPASIAMKVKAEGAGVELAQSRQGTVASNAEMSQRIAFAPDVPGDVQVLARAEKKGATDGLSSSVPVLTRMGDEQVVQTGWIDADALNLPLPALPEGASAPVLDVQLHRGLGGWQDGWLRDLHDYPHRCWEQTLSRAVGAALAIASGKDKSLWPDASTVVHDALAIAPAYQDEDGHFRYFLTTTQGDWTSPANPALSAYTLRSFDLLETLGYEPPKQARESLEKAVASTLPHLINDPSSFGYRDWETAAESAGALIDPKSLDDEALGKLWGVWDHLSWYGRSELVRALVRKPKFAEQARTGIQRLRDAGTAQGLRRVIHDGRDFSYFMGSDLRDQCGVVSALYEVDHDGDGDMARRSLLRGLQDLYAGGTASLDTQATAQCLIALHAVTKTMPVDDQAWQILASLGADTHALVMASHQNLAEWSPALSQPPTAKADTLRLQSQAPASATLNYTARLRYQLDLQQAQPHAVGMRLERRYQVLRDGAWVDPANAPIREGDWVRVRLTLDVPAFRHFVAITDIVPGGLVTRDISLSSVGGADLRHIGDQGSGWFDSRQTGANIVRMYAEQLPPGTHEVYYYAQAVQPGDYFAPPAVAELMYGRESRSTTAPSRFVIAPILPAAGH